MTEKREDDWLFPNATRDRQNQQQQGLLFAQKYLCFAGPTADPRARELLEHWTTMVRTKRIEPGASVQEYAAANALREFVEGLHQQIDHAMKGAQQLPPTTRKTNA